MRAYYFRTPYNTTMVIVTLETGDRYGDHAAHASVKLKPLYTFVGQLKNFMRQYLCI